MYMIVGLGNPGRKYEGTRHNVGFETIDALSERYRISVSEKAFRALIGRGTAEGEKVILVKPQTYMNNSGEAVRPLMDYYKIPADRVIVIYDDISLETGAIRVRGKGSAGGHNGMKSLIQHMGTQEFPRVRIGTGLKPPQIDLVDYVLGHFPPEQRVIMADAFDDGAAAAVTLMTEGLDRAMNRFNGAARKGTA